MLISTHLFQILRSLFFLFSAFIVSLVGDPLPRNFVHTATSVKYWLSHSLTFLWSNKKIFKHLPDSQKNFKKKKKIVALSFSLKDKAKSNFLAGRQIYSPKKKTNSSVAASFEL